MEVFETLKRRRSVRRFLPQAVSRAEIERILDAARYAPSAHNAQPWEFVVVTNRELRDQFATLGENTAFLGNVPVCIAVFCRESEHSLESGCASVQNLLVAATALGLGSCWVAGTDTTYAAEVARLVKARGNQHLVALVAIGYAAEEQVLRPPKRLLEDIMHWETF